LFWSGFLGAFVNLRPGDIGALTPAQLMEAYEMAEQVAKRG
jgi:hypothetical protein